MIGRIGTLGLAVAAGVVALLAAAGPSQAETYLLAINAGNRFAAAEPAATDEVKRLYLKRKSQWRDGRASTPLARPDDHSAQRAFVEHVLGMSETDLARHWNRLRNTTGATRPPTVASPRELLQRIARDPGAFGVIGEDEAPKLPAGVRVLFDFEATE